MVTLPAVADDEAQLQAESLARRLDYARRVGLYIRTAALILVLPAGGLWLAFGQYTQLLVIALVAFYVGVMAIIAGILFRRERAYAGFYILLGGLLSALAPAYVILEEGRPAVLLAYAMAVMLNMFLLGRRRSMLMNLLTLSSMVLSVVLTARGWVPAFPSLPLIISTPVMTIFTVAVAIVLTLVFRTMVVGQEQFFLAAGRASRELGRRAEAETSERERLEATVEQYAAYTAEVGQGRLDSRLELAAGDTSPLARLGQNLNDMVSSLQEMTRQVRDTARELTGAATEILATTVQQTSGASEQSAAISQASTSIDEVRAIAEQTADRSQGVADLAQRTAEVAQNGQQAVAEAIAGMGSVQQEMDAIAQNILVLSEQAQSIGQIIATVSEIASESNMLALNAAVEAARAGEAGRGFSVVASEVRALAEQSREATVQIKELLTEIQSGVNMAVMATEQGIKRVAVGSKLAGEAGLAIQELTGGVGESAQAAQQIVAAATQQEAGMEQVAQAMGQIHSVAGQTAVSAQQTERAAEELNRLAGRLDELVERYRL